MLSVCLFVCIYVCAEATVVWGLSDGFGFSVVYWYGLDREALMAIQRCGKWVSAMIHLRSVSAQKAKELSAVPLCTLLSAPRSLASRIKIAGNLGCLGANLGQGHMFSRPHTYDALSRGRP